MKVIFSVIMPVLNGSTHISRAIDSIFNQSYENIELIIIDGGSTDGTVEIIKEYNSRITYWVSAKDNGISDAINKGIKLCTGDIIAVLNSDDYWENNTIRDVLLEINRNPNNDIYFGKIRFHDPSTNKYYVREPNLKYMLKRMYVFHPALFVRKQAYESVGLYSNKYEYAMDAEWVHKAINANLNFIQVNSVLATMSLEGKSDIHYISALKEYRRSLLDNNITSTLRANYYFLKYVFIKTLMKISTLRKIKQKLF